MSNVMKEQTNEFMEALELDKADILKVEQLTGMKVELVLLTIIGNTLGKLKEQHRDIVMPTMIRCATDFMTKILLEQEKKEAIIGHESIDFHKCSTCGQKITPC